MHVFNQQISFGAVRVRQDGVDVYGSRSSFFLLIFVDGRAGLVSPLIMFYCSIIVRDGAGWLLHDKRRQ